MRKKIEILNEATIACDKVWYDRHQLGMESFYKKEKDPKLIECIKGGINAAKEMEKLYGKKNLGPYSLQ